MANRKVSFVEGEYYHLFNRGVEKRTIFEDEYDFERFLVSMTDFNSIRPIGSIFENSFRKKSQLGSLTSKLGKDKKPLVEYVAYCLNPNHFHLLVRQISEKGIEKLMHRLGTGYTKFFNEKYKRSGSLFQGTFKSVHIENNEQLMYLSVYVNLNNKVHGITVKNYRSSLDEYKGISKRRICNPDIVLKQLKSKQEYNKQAEELAGDIREKREDLKPLTLED